MLDEQEDRQWTGIERGLRRDRRFVARIRRLQGLEPDRWRLLGWVIVTIVGWWLFTPLLARWWNLHDAFLIALGVTAAAGLAYGTYSRTGRSPRRDAAKP